METLTREHEQAETPQAEAPDAPAPAPAERPCPTCGQAMAPGQEWCLECGNARPDRAGTAAAWRGATAVLAAVGVLASGAVAAAYAGLSADAKRVAAPNAQASLPAQQPPAPAPAPAPAAPETPPAPADEQPPPAAKTPPASAADSAPAEPPATPVTPSPPSGGTGSGSSSTPASGEADTDGGATLRSGPPRKTVAIGLEPDMASTYNPYGRPEETFGDPKAALDENGQTAWTAKVDPQGSGKTAVGLNVDLGKRESLCSLQLATSTPGMILEIYGARTADPPVSVQDPAWHHLANQLDVPKSSRIRLGDGTDQYRHLLVWITEAAPDAPQVALSELKLFSC